MSLKLDTGKTLKGSFPTDVTNDPSVGAKADVIILAVPSFAHEEYFTKLGPHMKPGTVVAAMPARSGGDILFSKCLGPKAAEMTFVGFETLPWACRFTEWGQSATILGTKQSILAAVARALRAPQLRARRANPAGTFSSSWCRILPLASSSASARTRTSPVMSAAAGG